MVGVHCTLGAVERGRQSFYKTRTDAQCAGGGRVPGNYPRPFTTVVPAPRPSGVGDPPRTASYPEENSGTDTSKYSA
jgi:hypothetical protein